jgi:putative ABC transport system permease protein
MEMGKLLQDVLLSLRGLRGRPGFALVAVSTIALGIAAAGAIWSVVDAVLVRPLPFSQPERLVFVWETMPARNVDRNVAGPANFVRWRERAQSFTDFAAFIRFETNLDGAFGEAERIAAGFTTGNLFTVLGARPLLGRTLLESDSAPGAADVVVLTEGYWRRRFGGDPAAVGRTLRLNGVTNTIVGVMPASVQIPPGAVLWAPLTVEAERMRGARGRWMTVVARLRDGVSVAQAHDEMARIGDALAAENKELDAGWGVNVQPFHADLVRQVRPGLVLLLIAVAALILIACVNVANLLLAAGVARERELAIRAALGAGRGRLLRQLLTESLVLAALAGILGAFAGRWLLGAIQMLLPPEIAEVVNVSYDQRAVAAAALVALASALVFGVIPAFQSARVGLTGALKEGGSVRGSGRTRSRLKQALVVTEVGLSALLLVATGLLLRSFWKLGATEPGFAAQGVLSASLAPSGDAYRDPARVQDFYREAMQRLRPLPGVTAAGAISWRPLTGGAATSFRLMSRPAPAPGEEPVADVRVVTPGLFETLRIPLLRGRDFDDSDRPKQPPVAIVNASLARELGGDAAAIGQRLKLSWRHDDEIEIVGVVGDVRLSSLDTPARATVYLPHGQDPNNFMTLMLRTSGSTGALVPGLRAAIAAIDPALPVGSAQPLEQVVSDSLRSRRFVLVLVAVFGGMALALAGIGLFGVMAYLVAQRTSELGVRLMLGARPRDVLELVVRDGMRLVAFGLALGLLAGVLASRALESQLFGVRPFDPLALAGVAAALALVSLLALAAPAWRAASIDPARAMRVD